jgi:hypothetical protein
MFSTLADKGNMNYFDVLGGNSLLSAKYEFVRHLSARLVREGNKYGANSEDGRSHPSLSTGHIKSQKQIQIAK